MEVVSGDNWTTGAISRAKLWSNHHHQETNIHFFTDRMPFLSPNQQCQHWRENITFHGLAYPKLTWGLPTLSLTTNSSWLPWGGFPCLSSALWCQYPVCRNCNISIFFLRWKQVLKYDIKIVHWYNVDIWILIDFIMQNVGRVGVKKIEIASAECA